MDCHKSKKKSSFSALFSQLFRYPARCFPWVGLLSMHLPSEKTNPPDFLIGGFVVCYFYDLNCAAPLIMSSTTDGS